MVERHLQTDVSIIRRQHGVSVVGKSALKHLEYFAPVFDDEYCSHWTLGSCHAGNIMVNCRSSKAVVTNRPFPLVYANPAGGESPLPPFCTPLSG